MLQRARSHTRHLLNLSVPSSVDTHPIYIIKTMARLKATSTSATAVSSAILDSTLHLIKSWSPQPSLQALLHSNSIIHSTMTSSSSPLRSKGAHHRRPQHILRPSHSLVSLALLVAFSLTLLIHHATTSPIPSSSDSGAAVSDGSSPSTASGPRKDSVEDAFRAQLTNDSSSKVYIDTLSPEEVAIHRKTGRLPKRTMELIEQVLKAQEALKQQAATSSVDGASSSNSSSSKSSVEAADLYAELFPKGRQTK